MIEHRYKDKNHPPVPQLKVGDRCYTFCTFGIGRRYDYVTTCEVRKVEVKWYEPSSYDREKGAYGYWYIDYYIRTDVDYKALKSTRMYAYRLGDDGREPDLFLTPQEVMDENIRDFKDMVAKNIESMRKTMHSLGYSEEQTKKLLESK